MVNVMWNSERGMATWELDRIEYSKRRLYTGANIKLGAKVMDSCDSLPFLFIHFHLL